MGDTVLIGMMTHPDRKAMESVIQEAVEQNLIACGNILPAEVDSFFKWEGKLEKTKESVVIFKTTGEQAKACIQFFKEAHPYNCPEILLWEVSQGHPDYLNWVRDACVSPTI